jgi:trimeric autotransporter adhesin
VAVGATVVLNGSGSTSVDGRPLTYAWTLTALPAGSTATLTGANTVMPTFVADKAGTYMAQLIVNDGLPSNPSTVTITTGPVKPVANAGPNQVVNVNSLVQLDGSKSTDANGLPLTFQWNLISVPAGSAAVLSNPAVVNPTFTADRPGTYVAQLIVNNGMLSSDPATVMITTNPVLAPTANAGPNQTAIVGQTVQLNGSGTDPQNLPLTFQWALISKPAGSAATLSSTVIPNPTFVPDLPGTYIAQLTVNNGFLSSAPATVTISTTCSQPTANPGPNQNAIVGTTVTLDGSGSGDACHDPLTYAWSFTTRPAGSTATLSGATTVSPSFVPDVAGTYVVQLIVNNGFTSSNPATVTITAFSGASIQFFPSSLDLTGSPGSLTVILSSPAGPGGQIVNLASSDNSIATVPASVTIAAGTVAVNVTVTPGTASGTAIITGSAPGFASGTATVNVNLSTITITLDSSTIGLSSTINGVITLSQPSPAGTVVTLLASPGGIVNVQPTSVTIPAGSKTGGFTVTGVALGSTTITASSPGYGSGSANVTVGGLGQIILPSGVTVGANQSVPFPVMLVTGAPVGGVTIALASSDTSTVTISPASVFIPFKATTPAVQPQVTGVAIGTATISASAPGFIGDSKPVQVVGAISFSPSTLGILVGNTGNLTLTLTGQVPAGGLTVNLSSSDPSKATVPATVSFTVGMSSVNVPVTAVAQGLVTITASAPGLTPATATVNVLAFGQIILAAGVTVGQGQSTVFPVSLSQNAPPGGVTVNLVSSDTSKVTVTPSVFIAGGATTPAVPAQVTGINFGSANITASAAGFTSATQPVTVPAPLSFTPGSLTLTVGSTQNLTLNLAAPAPAGGVTVNLSSSDPSKVSVPASVNFAAGATSVPVPVTGVAVGSATITASAMGFPSATASVTVQAPLTMSFTGSPLSITVGGTGNLTLNLSGPAPAGGLTVNLSSSNTAAVSVPPTVTFAAGATSVPVPVTGVAIGSATITASAAGLGSAMATVNVAALAISVPANTTVALGQSAAFGVTLSQPAPAGGVTVNLTSSDTSKVTVSASVFIPAGATTAAVQPQVTGVGIGSATVTASAAGYAPGTGTVTVSAPTMSFTGSPLTINAGVTGNLTLNLTGGQAPAGGLTINLSSSNTGVATVPATVTFGAGATSVPVPVTGVGPGSTTITASAAGIGSATASVTVLSDIIVPANTTVAPGDSAPFPVTLVKAAPAGGVFITLTSSDPSKVTVTPANVFIPQGAFIPNAPPKVNGIAAGSAIVTASAAGLSSASGLVTVGTSGPLTMSFLGDLTLTVSTTGNLTLNLSGPAPAGGLTVNLSSSNRGVATVPATVTFAANTTSVAVPVTGVSVGSATITASAPGIPSATAGVTVGVASGGSSFFSPGSLTVTTGSTGNLTLNLSGPAPAGLTASLSSTNTGAATVPATVTFTTGATSVNVPVTGVAAGSATIAASTPGFGNASASVTVAAPAIILPANVTLQPGQQVNFPVTLSSPAPAGGVFITLTSSDTSKVTVSPMNVFIAEGGTGSTQPNVTGGNLGSATITATASGFAPASTLVTVSSGAALSLSPGNLTIAGTATQNLTLTLPAPAPPGGQTVNLSSSNPGVATVPASVTVNQSATTASVPVTGVAPGSTTITASAAGFTPANATVTVTGASPIILPANVMLAPGDTVNFPVTLAAPAPAGGAFVNLTSSDTSKVTISPSAIFFSEGMTTTATTPKVTGVNFGVSIITASANGIGSASQPVSVTSGLSFQPSSLVITGTATTKSLTLTLTTPAPAGGLTFSVSSSDTSVATVPSSVTFPANSTSVNVPVTSVAPGSAVIQTGAQPAFPSAAATVTVVTSPTVILPAFDAVGIRNSVPLPVSLSTPAPPGGVTVTLISSDPSKFTVTPSSVFIAAGVTAPAVLPSITGGDTISSEGFSTVTASAPGYATASLQIHVSDAITISLPTNLSVKLGQTVPLPVALPGPAPAGGVTLTITSTDPTVASVTATAFVPAGANMPATLPLVTGKGLGFVTIEASGGSYTSGVQPLQVVP